jgi:hypothetical protein
MWVNAREREKNKEKCVNGAMFLTPPVLAHLHCCLPAVLASSSAYRLIEW